MRSDGEKFERELSLISNHNIRAFVADCLAEVPDKFWTEPASTSGKYHPPLSLGEGDC